ncbi:hypothetical protein C8R44DRAFT_988654 [Mycena epipterygia]|nr:hypothetical protein C8R44DRAFT_988654 [Mycena epipterygia]
MHIPVCHTPGAKLDHANRDRCILDDRATSWEPSIIVKGARVRMTPSPVILLYSHHYLEPPAHVAFPNSSCLFHGAGAFCTTHMKLTTFTRICFLPSSPEAPLDIPLDVEVWHGAARYLPAVATDATTPIPPFLRPLSHLTNFISRLKTRVKASDERRMYSVAGGVKRAE